MKQTLIVGICGIAVSAAMLALGLNLGSSTPVPVEEPAAIETPQAAEPDRGAVEAIVRDYLLNNPEVMLEVQAALEAKQHEEQRIAQSEAIAEQSSAIFNAASDGHVGNSAGKVTVVEFFDYNCGFCKRAMADMDALVQQDNDVRFVLKEFPILGPDSQKAHVVSMAFRTLYPEKYGPFHRELLNGPGRADEAKAMRIALELGGDEAAIRKEMENPEIQATFSKTYELANALSITGTPSYVVGDEVVFGALGLDVLSEKVANFRSCQSTVC
ncbi:MAG: DsbA family protein [Rhizobiaceae bacterium]